VQDDDSRAAHLRFLENMERINRAMQGTKNFANHAALVAAEIARLEGRELDAERLYEQAIGSARESGLVHDEALANELAARFYAARGFGKVRQLDQLHPHPREEERAPGPTATIGAPVEHLDIATVMKVSQAVSGETFLESLIDTVMRTAVEQAGAERGLLILARGSEQRIAADATTGGEALSVHLRDEPATAAMLPESVLHYVMRTQESVILDDASVENPFSTDPYIRQQRLRSIVCLPLLNQAKRIGALYLENNLAARVFSPGRIAVLKLLAAQAAISLENTRLDRDLAERETRIRRLFNADIIGIFIWDFDGRVLEANDAFLRIVGYEREDLDAGRMRWADMTPPDLREREAERVREHKRTGGLQPFEKEYFRKDGSRVPVLVGVTIFEEGGNQGVGFVLDLTERKRTEEELQQTREELARVSRVTTLGELTAAIAHEVNQPLHGLLSSGNACLRWLANDTPDLEAARRAVERMIRDGSRAAEVISRIRALVKKSPVRKTPLNINDVVAEVLSLVRVAIQHDRIALRTSLADDLPLILGDRIQLQQVILNLVVNANEALRAVTDGPRELVITSTKDASNDVLVTVSDTGPGFDGAKLENIFDPFYTTKPEGMGIGLAVSRSIIEAHGGKLWAAPNEPRGAVFQLTLPGRREEPR